LNAFWTLLGHVVSKGAGFAFVVVVARGIGASGYGEFNFALSFVSLFLLAGSYSIEPVVIRELARSRDRLSEVFSSGLVLRGLLAASAFLLAMALSPLFTDGGEQFAVVVVLGAALCLDEITLYSGSVYKAFERAALHSLAIVTNRVASVVLALVVLSLGGGILAVSVAYLAGSLGSLAFAWRGLRRFGPIDLRAARRPMVRQLLCEGLPMATAGVCNAALFRVDAILLQAIKGPLAGGFYGVAYRFFESFLFLAWSLTDLCLPRIARAGRGPEAGRIFQLGVAAMLAFLLPVAVIAPFSAEWVVTTVFSEGFRPAAAAVPWLAAAGAFYGIAYTARVSAVALHGGRAAVGVAAFVLAVNVAGNLVAIPRYGFEGAAVVTCLSEALEAVLLLVAFRRVNGGLSLQRPLLVPVAAAGVTLVALTAAGAHGAAGLALGALTYVAALPLSVWFLYRGGTAALLRDLQPGKPAAGKGHAAQLAAEPSSAARRAVSGTESPGDDSSARVGASYGR